MASVYILYSKSITSYYIGSCKKFVNRYVQHLDKTFNKSFTRRANDWEVFLLVENLNYKQARNIERHIKSMKSKKYIQNLKIYPEIMSKLITKYRE